MDDNGGGDNDYDINDVYDDDEDDGRWDDDDVMVTTTMEQRRSDSHIWSGLIKKVRTKLCGVTSHGIGGIYIPAKMVQLAKSLSQE